MKYGKGGRKKTESSWRNRLKWRPNTREKKLPKLWRGNGAQRRLGARRKKQSGAGAVGSRGAGGSTDGAGREEERGKGKIEA